MGLIFFFMIAGTITASLAAGVGAAWTMKILEFNTNAQGFVGFIAGLGCLVALGVSIAVFLDERAKEEVRKRSEKAE